MSALPAKIRRVRVRVMRIQLPIATSWNEPPKENLAFNVIDLEAAL